MAMKTDGPDGKGQTGKCQKEAPKPEAERSSKIIFGGRTVPDTPTMSKENAARVLQAYVDCLYWLDKALPAGMPPEGISLSLRISEKAVLNAINSADGQDKAVDHNLLMISYLAYLAGGNSAISYQAAAEAARNKREKNEAAETLRHWADSLIRMTSGSPQNKLVPPDERELLAAIDSADKADPAVRGYLTSMAELANVPGAENFLSRFAPGLIDAVKKALEG